MTKAVDIIVDALTDLRILDAGGGLSAEDAAASLRVLNLLITSMPERVGRRLVDAPASGDQAAQAGYRYHCDTRAAPFVLTLPPDPSDGQTLAVADSQRHFATHNLGLLPNGRLLEGNPLLRILETAGDNRTWMFRGDTGDWERLRPLSLNALVPFPPEMEEPLAWMLAGRLAQTYGDQGATLEQKVAAKAAAGLAAFVRRYGKRGSAQLDPALTIDTQGGVRRTTGI